MKDQEWIKDQLIGIQRAWEGRFEAHKMKEESDA